MRRGDILLVELDPLFGAEQNKTRPCVLVSSNAANDSTERRGRGVVTVVPLTSNVAAVYPFQVLLSQDESGLARPSKAQAEQVRSLASERIVRTIGAVSAAKMLELDDALRLHLSL